MGYVIGIDIGGTRTKIGLVDTTAGKVCQKEVFLTEKKNEKIFLEKNLSMIRWMEERIPSGGKAKGVGIAASGFVHTDDGRMDGSCGSFLEFFSGYPLKKKIEESAGLPCSVGNDAQLACYGECLYGAGRGYRNVLMLTLGTGVGVGFIQNGRRTDSPAYIHRAGHIKVRGDGEEDCYCGIRGCLERTCCAEGLQKLGTARYIAYLAAGLNQYIYLYAPDLIILGGGAAPALNDHLSDIRSRITATVCDGYKIDIAIGQLQEEGGILGAAAYFQK